MPDEIEVICPECWTLIFIDVDETDEMIICQECDYEFDIDESVTD